MEDTYWQINKSPLQCMKYMLEHEIDCDVNFKVGESQETIKAHKLILSMRSPVFQKMLNGSFVETRQDPVIPDVDPEAFKSLLRYCYYDCVDIEVDDAFSILSASKKYMLPLLESTSRNKLIQGLSGSNIWDIYTYAISVEDTELHNGCKSYFQGSVIAVREALDSEAFLKIPYEVLLNLLQINKAINTVIVKAKRQYYKNSFGISISEIELFKACSAWAAEVCLRQEIDPTGANKREVLGQCLFLIRFPAMIYEELVNVVYPIGILTQAEEDNLFLNERRQTGSPSQVEFPLSKREFMVVTSEPMTNKRMATLYIESKERVLLTRIWTAFAGSYNVTVKGDRYEPSWRETCTSIYQKHVTGRNDSELNFLEIEPQIIDADHRHSVTIKEVSEIAIDDISNREYTVIGLITPMEEVKITKDPNTGDIIYALTLSFV